MKYIVYIVELYSSYVSGFDTYKRELLAGLSADASIGISRIVLESPSDKFSVETCDGIIVYQVPRGLINVEESVSALLSMHVCDSPRTCFFLNFSPASRIAKALKEAFCQSRLVTIMHDFRWASHLMGDVFRLRSILDNGVQKQGDELILRFYQEDLALFTLSDVIVCLSQDSYDIISTIYQVQEKKLRLIHNGLRDLSQIGNDVEVRKAYNIPQGDHVLLYSGRVSPQKGAMAVLACFREVLRQHPNSWLVIAGKGDSEIPPEIRLRVITLGQVSQKSLFAWYRAADLGLLPSFYEQCSYTGIEMKMFGLPVVASDGIGVRNMFGEQGAIVAEIGPSRELSFYRESLRKAIVHFLDLSLGERKALKLAARKHYEQVYTQARMRDKYIDLVREC